MRHLTVVTILLAITACSGTPSGTGPTGPAAVTEAPSTAGGSDANNGAENSTDLPADVSQPNTVVPDEESSAVVCGNGKTESGEECDDGNTVSADGCSAICKTESCGDGVIQSGLGEECDGSNLNNSSCATFGFSLGNLTCASGCKFDKAGCSNPPPAPVCGNSKIESGEQCDDGNVVSGDGCSAICKTEFCGDGSVQQGIGEACDGNNLNGSSCVGLGFDSGTLLCAANCTFNTSACVPLPTVQTQFTADDNLWNQKKQTNGSITFNVSNASAVDGKVVALMFPGDPALGPDDKKSPSNATQISTKQKLGFGKYRTRVRFATCDSSEEVVNGVFLYSYGGDTNGNGVKDNNEIDFEVLCGEPNYLWMSSWTDYEVIDGKEVFRKVTRVVNMKTGSYYQTVAGKEGEYGMGPKGGTIDAAKISNFATTGDFYEMGIDWSSTAVRFFIVNNGEEVTLWTLNDTTHPNGASYIPQNPAYFMYNLWHTGSHWWVGGEADYPAANAIMEVDWFKFWAE